MIVIAWLVTIALFWFIGEAVARLLGDVPRWLAGAGACGATLFVLGVLRVPFGIALAAIAVAAAVVVCTVHSARCTEKRSSLCTMHHALCTLPIAILLVIVSLVPLHDYDGTAFWVLKAKAIATEHRIDGDFFRGRGTFSPRNQYPLLVPLDAAAIMFVSGTDDDGAIRWLYPLILLALALEVRRRAGVWPALIVVCLPQLLTAPEGGAASAYSDIALAAFVAMAFFELVDGLSPARLGFWSACAALTKNEGLPFAIVLCAAGAFVFRRRIAAALVPVAAAIAALFVWRAAVPRTDEEDLIGLMRLLPQRLGRLPEAIGGLAKYAVKIDDWGVFWIAVAIAAIVLAWRREWRPLALACGVIGAMIAVYVAIFMVTAWSVPDLLKVSAARLLTHFAGPAAWLLSASARSR